MYGFAGKELLPGGSDPFARSPQADFADKEVQGGFGRPAGGGRTESPLYSPIYHTRGLRAIAAARIYSKFSSGSPSNSRSADRISSHR